MQVASTTQSDHAAVARAVTMPPPLAAHHFELADARTGRITCYADGPAGSTERPLLLIHSVNAAATAYEMKPLFEHYRQHRPVYALDLPGFGLSDRADRIYTPRIMTDAILLAANEIRRRHGDVAVDVIALSLGCEFAARAGTEAPNLFRTLALLSPTGFDRRAEAAANNGGGDKNATRAMPWLRKIFTVPLWKHRFFTLLTSRASIRFFLRKTFGRKDIDEGLLEYDYITTHQPGAENAPYSFVSGYMFSVHALKLYQALAMPVWMVHGVRGDFVDYNGKHAVEGLPNWTIQVMQTGAMPHFEQLDKVVAGYDDFLTRAAGA
ncbi:alpha/beta fold hydrolase [Bradyrhizobium sp. HKCCYLS3077]|uniref:alpha/beta fold hydrolase n=1 Tax=Bradyrhizobium sp. HKCCYLS3077 TaxID=3420761 RepID=UPI003EBF0CBC